MKEWIKDALLSLVAMGPGRILMWLLRVSPIAFVLVALITFGTTYAVTILNDDSEQDVVFISETGDYNEERLVFTYGVSHAAFWMFLVYVIQFLRFQGLINQELSTKLHAFTRGEAKHTVGNTISLIIGVLTVVAFLGVGAVPYVESHTIHMISAFSLFIGTILYTGIVLWLSFALEGEAKQRWCYTRLACWLLQLVSMIGLIVLTLVTDEEFEPHDLPPTLQAAALCEWVFALCLAGFVLTYYFADFRAMAVEVFVLERDLEHSSALLPLASRDTDYQPPPVPRSVH